MTKTTIPADQRWCILCDIDGTLADLRHRLHHVRSGSPDWRAFFAAMGGDKPIQYVIVTLGAIERETGLPIFLVSGRPDSHRDITAEWLKQAGVQYDDLYMRKVDDHRSDVVVKREILQHIREQGYEPWLVIDDRPSVIQMWKGEDLNVLQVDNGSWDDSSSSTLGTLYMLIGPSGAGKSVYAVDHFGSDEIVSSDRIRAQLCGDFRDQSRNADVFRAVHSVAKARIEGGLNACIDATNIRTRDRRSILDIMPASTPIRYLVIDRPIEQKRRDAGWRANVVIKDTPLIDKHHQTFQSNLKDILAGDNDDRVQIEDLRCT